MNFAMVGNFWHRVLSGEFEMKTKSTDSTTEHTATEHTAPKSTLLIPLLDENAHSTSDHTKRDTASFSHLIANDPRLQVYNDTVPAGILILRTEDGSVIFSNSAFNDIFGVEGNAVLGAGWETFFVNPDDRQRLMVKFVEEEEVRGMELQLRHLDGSIIWGQVSLSEIPIDDEDLLLFAFVDITALKKAEEEISQLANHDPLTMLPNLRLFGHLISKAISRSERESYQTAVMFIDLDDFKEVNDTLGHEAGDDALKEVAKRLLTSVRETDSVARIGGDEFVVLLENLDSSSVRIIGQRIVDHLSKAITLAVGEAYISASIGVAFYPQHGNNAKVLIKAADKAMYDVKKNTKRAVAFA